MRSSQTQLEHSKTIQQVHSTRPSLVKNDLCQKGVTLPLKYKIDI